MGDVGSEELGARGGRDGGGAGRDVEFGADVVHVVGDGVRADDEGVSDLAIGPSRRH